MSKNFTPENLIAYLYGETTVTELLAIENAICGDPILANDYDELAAAYDELPRVTFNAPRTALQAVLRYSEKTALEQQV